MNNNSRVRKTQSATKGKVAESTQNQLKDLPVAELLKRLQTSPDGLGKVEAGNRLGKYGYNELPEKKENPLLKFLAYFWGPIPIMILVAAILSAVLRHRPLIKQTKDTRDMTLNTESLLKMSYRSQKA